MQELLVKTPATAALKNTCIGLITATALAPTIQEAAAIARHVIEQVQYEGKYFRRDIGYEFV